jgi:hypothetical protein
VTPIAQIQAEHGIAAGLHCGHDELARSLDPRRSALLVTDGMFTAGSDPRIDATRFNDLPVLLIREHEHSGAGWVTPRRLVREAIARSGHGHVACVDGFSQLPRSVVEVAGRLLRKARPPRGGRDDAAAGAAGAVRRPPPLARLLRLRTPLPATALSAAWRSSPPP